MTQDSDCLFCRIVRGELPSTRIDEDDRTLTFAGRPGPDRRRGGPPAPGHLSETCRSVSRTDDFRRSAASELVEHSADRHCTAT